VADEPRDKAFAFGFAFALTENREPMTEKLFSHFGNYHPQNISFLKQLFFENYV